MNPKATLTQESKFERKLLYVDNFYIEDQLKRLNDAIPAFEEALSSARKLLRRGINSPDLIRILTRKSVALNELIAEECSIEGVLPSKYMELRGLDKEYRALLGLFDRLRTFNEQHYQIMEVEFGVIKISVSPTYKAALKETFTYYTHSEKQNKTLQFLREFADNWNTIFRENMVQVHRGQALGSDSMDEYWYIRPLSTILKIERDAAGKEMVVPNYDYIRRL